METFKNTVMEFVTLVQNYKFMEALDKFYDKDVISADNTNPPTTNRESLCAETQKFIDNAQIEKIELTSLLIEENLTMVNFYYKFKHTKFGDINTQQISVQRWKNNKIIQEHHFYNLA